MIDSGAASDRDLDEEHSKCCVCDLGVNAGESDECVGRGGPICDARSTGEDDTPGPLCMAIAEEEGRERERGERETAPRPAKAGRSPVRHVRLGATLDGALRRES